MFFFFKQKTAYEIVSRDWSSDVCSSDLTVGIRVGNAGEIRQTLDRYTPVKISDLICTRRNLLCPVSKAQIKPNICEVIVDGILFANVTFQQISRLS